MTCFRGATKVLDFFSGSGVKVAATRVSRVISEGCVGRTGIYVFVRIEEAMRRIKGAMRCIKGAMRCIKGAMRRIKGAMRRKMDKRTPTQE